MKTVKVRLNKNETSIMGFEHNKTYKLIPVKAENGMTFYQHQGGLFLQSRFHKVKK